MSELWPHQARTLHLYKNTDRVLDFSDAGTGKTRAALEAFRMRRRQGGGRAIIIAPKTLLESAWAAELRKFFPDLTYSIAYAKNRAQAFGRNVDVFITNTDAATWLGKQKKDFFVGIDTIIIDEISDFKNKDAQRSRALRRIIHFFAYRSGMTATPTANTITDLWHQAFLIDDGARLGKSFYHFRNAVQYQVPNPKYKMYSIWEDKEGATEAVHDLLRDITVRHGFEDVMTSIPENQEYYVTYDPSAKLLKAYKELKDFALIVAEKGEVVSAVNAASLRQKLLQVASGAVYGESGVVILDEGRTKLIMDLVHQRNHCVVFYSWKHQLAQLIKEAEARGVSYACISGETPDRDRGHIIQQYQAGKFKVLFLHPKTGAHGLTLTRGTSVIWCSPTDRADWLVQGKHRVYRGGQTEATESVMVCANDTLEQAVYNNTTGKRFGMQELLKLLQETPS